MLAGRIRGKDQKGSLYTFSCYRSPATEDAPSNLGPGFSRIVHCNEPHLHEKKPLKYCCNYISTTKYNIITFIPKALFEQFRRVANLYFLMAAIVSATTNLSPFSAFSMIAPLVFVVGLSMAKEALEDSRRFVQDMKVGDVVKVEKDQFFPADLLLLSSSYEDGICYVETMNLDGENGKSKAGFGEIPTVSPSKRSRDRTTDGQGHLPPFTALLSNLFASSIGFAVYAKFELPNWWYLQPMDKVNNVVDPNKPELSGLLHLVTALILYGYLIPISSMSPLAL
ncbi:hypothetical protein HAX54_009860 [Datura stramonium]|uniref:P-type ATPase N-terminal domain-containing protein n=1 Tax=Datura stramonium TaxID=4076 RepID=A0ABS8TI03_DATST|nr:hypothetical protein [Datura stramonium]